MAIIDVDVTKGYAAERGSEAAFWETMSTGLVPLFTAMLAGIVFMLLLAAFATAILRPRLNVLQSKDAGSTAR